MIVINTWNHPPHLGGTLALLAGVGPAGAAPTTLHLQVPALVHPG